MDIEMFGKLSDAFGPSGFEEDVIRTIADYCKEFDVENDAMNNLYVRMPGTKQDSRPVIQLDAHLDACGFMVQNIQDNGCLGIIMLGGFHLTSFRHMRYGSAPDLERWYMVLSAQNRFIS